MEEKMNEEMKRAAQVGDIDAFYRIIERNPSILKEIEALEFVETPLHTAASCGNTAFAIEMLSLMPSFGRKLDPRGYSPLDLALHNSHKNTVKLLIRYDPKLIQFRSRERKTPLHYVAETDNADLLSKFLLACPTAIKEVTIRGETAVHLAVSNRCFQAFKVLMGWIYRTGNKRILDCKDNEGYTVLHIAAKTGQLEVVKILTREQVHLNIKNQDDMTALDIVEQQIQANCNQEYENIQKILHKVGAMKTSELPKKFKMVDLLQRIPRLTDLSNIIRSQAAIGVDSHKGLTEDVRNAYLVVTILLVTASFQAVLSPPGGGWEKKDDDNNNNSNNTPPSNTTMKHSIHKGSSPSRRGPKEGLFYPFLIMNSITFALSVALTFTLLPLHGENTALLLWSLVFLTVTYSMSVVLISPNYNSQWVIAVACLFAALFGVHGFLIYSMLIQVAGARWIPIPSVTSFIRRICVKNIKRYHMERLVRLGKYKT